MSSAYDPPDSSKHIRDWLAATSNRHSDRSRHSTSGDSHHISERSNTGRSPSSDRPHNRFGPSKRPTRSTFAPIPETAECAPEQERRQRFDHSLFELTMQEGCTGWFCSTIPRRPDSSFASGAGGEVPSRSIRLHTRRFGQPRV
jgi:hypothetical protein